VLIAAAVVLVLVAGGAVLAARSVRAAAAERERVAALEQALIGFTEASTALSGALDAAATALTAAPLGVTVEEVADAATVEALHDAHAELQALVDSPPAAWGADTDGWDTEALAATTGELVAHTAAVTAATAATTAASEAVQTSHDAWVLDRATNGWATAREDLAAAIEAARALLESSNDKVADAQTRFDLTAAIDAAQTAHDQHVDDQNAAALDAAAASAAEHTHALRAASDTVSASQAQWQQTEDAKQAQQPVANTPGTGKKPVNIGTVKGNGAAPKQQTGQGSGTAAPGGASSVATAPQQDNRNTWEDFGLGSGCFGGNSNGDTWTC
jgi:hypothetical protein